MGLSMDKKTCGKVLLLTAAGALVLLSYLKGVLISLDIDESYAVAMGYRLVRGDALVRDMWEPHQFSAFGVALFAAPYVWLRGNADYLVIYLRSVCVLIHSSLGFLMYRLLRKRTGQREALCVLFLHLLFLPKWVQSLEFELMHYWFLLGIFLSLYAYFAGEKSRGVLPFTAGVCLAGCITCYPTMIILYPFYLCGIRRLERRCQGKTGWDAKGRMVWKGSSLFTAGLLLAGGGILICLLSCLSWKELPHYLSYIFMDASHNTYTMYEKWRMYLEQVSGQLLDYFVYFLAAVLIVLCGMYFGKIFWGTFKKFETALFASLMLAAFFLQMKALYGFLSGDENQFFYQGRFMALIFPALLLCFRYKGRMTSWFWLCILPALLSVLAVLFVTNMDTNVTYAKAFLGVIGSVLVFGEYGRMSGEGNGRRKIFPVLCRIAGAALCATLLVCRILLIRVSGCLPVSILAPLEKLEIGPAAGIYVLRDTAEIWNDNYRILSDRIMAEDKLLYIGAENLVYVATDAVAATPSTQGTTVYNEMFLHYYQEHPELLPNVVVFDRSYAEDPVCYLSFSASLQSGVFFDWLKEYCADGTVEETDHLVIVRKARI